MLELPPHCRRTEEALWEPLHLARFGPRQHWWAAGRLFASFYSWAPPSGLLTASPAAFGNPGPFTGLPSLVLQPFPSTPPLQDPFSSPQPQADPRSSGLPPHPDPIPIYPFCLLDLLPFVCFSLLLSLRLPRKITSFPNILLSNSFIANFWSHHGPDSGLSL